MSETANQAKPEEKPAAKKAAPKAQAPKPGEVRVDEKGRKTRFIGKTVVADS